MGHMPNSSAASQSHEFFQPKLGLYMVQKPSPHGLSTAGPARHNSTKNSNLSTQLSIQQKQSLPTSRH